MVIPGESQSESVIGWFTRQLPESKVIGGERGALGSLSHIAKRTRGTAGVNFLSIEWGKGNTDRKREAERGNCTHCPSTTLSPWKPPKSEREGAVIFHTCQMPENLLVCFLFCFGKAITPNVGERNFLFKF